MVSVVGFAVGIFLFFAYVATVIAALILGIIAVGRVGQKMLLKKDTVTFVTPLMGAILFVVISAIPFVGGFLILALISVSVGVIAHTMFHSVRA